MRSWNMLHIYFCLISLVCCKLHYGMLACKFKSLQLLAIWFRIAWWCFKHCLEKENTCNRGRDRSSVFIILLMQWTKNMECWPISRHVLIAECFTVILLRSHKDQKVLGFRNAANHVHSNTLICFCWSKYWLLNLLSQWSLLIKELSFELCLQIAL